MPYFGSLEKKVSKESLQNQGHVLSPEHAIKILPQSLLKIFLSYGTLVRQAGRRINGNRRIKLIYEHLYQSMFLFSKDSFTKSNPRVHMHIKSKVLYVFWIEGNKIF